MTKPTRTNGWLWLVAAFCSALLPAHGQSITLLNLTNFWSYSGACQDGTGWEQPGFDDASWASGPGGFGAGETRATILPILSTTNLLSPSSSDRTNSGGVIGGAYYFRTHFTVDSPAGLSLVFSNAIDDGAEFFLNGIRIKNLRVAIVDNDTDSGEPDDDVEGPAACAQLTTSRAIGPNGDAMLWEVFVLDPVALNGALLAGDNVLAVAVHQSSTNSSDMVFASMVSGYLSTLPEFVSQPSSVTVSSGDPASFTAAATGTPSPSFQWYQNGVAIPGATSATFSISAAQASDVGDYYVVAANTAGSVTSSVASLTIVSPPVFTSLPLPATASVGDTVVLSVTASGDPAPMFQWIKDGTPIPGATDATLTLSPAALSDSGSYAAAASNSAGSITSAPVAVLVTNDVVAAVFVTQPVGAIVTNGAPVSFAGLATGIPAPSYQWLKDGLEISNAITPQLIIAATSFADAGGYSLVASNSSGSVTSEVAVLTVLVPPSIITQPVGVTVTNGQPATLQVVATGFPAPTYQWTKGGSNVLNATGDTLTFAAASFSDAGDYVVLLANAAGSIASATATLTVLPDANSVAPVIVTQPTSITVTNGTAVTFSASAAGTPDPSLQWLKNGVAIAGAIAPDYTIAATVLGDAGRYALVAANASGSVTSQVAVLTVLVGPNIVTQPASVAVTNGRTATFRVVATGTPAPTYQWAKGGTSITSATNATLTLAAVTANDAGSYAVVVANSVGSITSSSATLTVLAAATNGVVAPVITTQPLSHTATNGTATSFRVVATGTAPLTYQWRKDSVNIAGATSATYTIATVSSNSAGTYSVVVANSAGTATSSGAVLSVYQPVFTSGTAVLVAWSEKGMHEYDSSDASVFVLAPPYNTIHAQLIVNGLLATTSNGLTVTYQALADASGSINKSSVGKGNFYQYVNALFSASLAPDQGLAGFGMPGSANTPQAMLFDSAQRTFSAVGIPITPYDDQGHTNNFPMMRLTAKNSAGTVLAIADIALPVSDAMDCRSCHQSGAPVAGRPAQGWAWDLDPIRDYKLNILRNHDSHHHGQASYDAALKTLGYNAAGLEATVVQDHRPVSCVSCHQSGLLAGTGIDGMRPLTQLMHNKHASNPDPDTGVPLGQINDSGACLRCHAGSESFRVRGVHHALANADGTAAMNCQSCHGSMTDVGTEGRQGWVDLPMCQSCHTGTQTANSGSIRYTSVFVSNNVVRLPANSTFASEANTPTNGISLFRASHGHGELSCQACHGTAHAELASTSANENVQTAALQGNAGVLMNCTICHPGGISSANGGPHGMHQTDSRWASNHEGGRSTCTTCHGSDSRGALLSRAGASHTFSGNFGTHTFAPGNFIGCYDCHNGPGGGDDGGGGNPNHAPTATSVAASTLAGSAVPVALRGSDPDGNSLIYHVLNRPMHGKILQSGATMTYFPNPEFTGTDSFTYAAWDSSADSAPATASITVNPSSCAVTAKAFVARAAFPNAPVPFRVDATLTPCASTISYEWDFGDGSAHSTAATPSHVYAANGDYNWSLTVSANGTSKTVTGVITVSPTLGPPLALSYINWGGVMTVSWVDDPIPVSLETCYDVTDTQGWFPVIDPPYVDPTIGEGLLNVDVYFLPLNQYFRLRRVP